MKNERDSCAESNLHEKIQRLELWVSILRGALRVIARISIGDHCRKLAENALKRTEGK